MALEECDIFMYMDTSSDSLTLSGKLFRLIVVVTRSNQNEVLSVLK